MSHQTESSVQVHFHIRWSSGVLDWERHSTAALARQSAMKLVRPGESYLIENCNKSSRTCTSSSDQFVPITREELGLGDHVAYFFKTNEERLSFVIPYIISGLENFERCIYIADENSVSEILNEFAKTGIDVKAATVNGALSVITKHDSYLKHGGFEPERMIEDLDRNVRIALQSGFSGLRITGEMSWALNWPPTMTRLCEYEQNLRKYWPKQLGGLCQYNENLFTSEILDRMTACHNVVARDGIIIRHCPDYCV